MIVNFKYVDEHSEVCPKSFANVNDKSIENVKLFRYLSVDVKFDQSSTENAEIDLHITVAELKFNQLCKN